MTTVLIYKGRGDAFIGVPAQDLTEQDFAERKELWQELGITEAVLLESGLYEKPKLEQPKKEKAAKDGK